MPVHLITAPVEEPVDLEMVKAKLEVDLGLRDDELELIISAAREHTESHLRRALVTQTWELVLERFANENPLSRPPQHGDELWVAPAWSYYDYLSEPWGLLCHRPYIELPFGELASVVSVTYVDGGGTIQTLTPVTDYSVDTVNVPGRIRPAFGKAWPQHRLQWDAVRVQYVVGWAVDAVPNSIKLAMLMLVNKLYEHDEDVVTPAIAAEIRLPFEALLAPHRIIRMR